MAGPSPTKWQRAALRLAECLPRDRLNAAVRAFADGETSVARAPWLLACSGGSDSVALVLLGWAHWPTRRADMVLAHFDHRLRGAASTNDARFCASLARGLGLRYVGGRWDNAPDSPSEALCRSARNQFLETQGRAVGAKVIWTGHQRDDVAETMLMRLARGSGSAGMAAPRPVQMTAGDCWRLRPLLDIGRDPLREALAEVGARWREDGSNASGDYFRNRLRSVVVPAWMEAARRDAVQGAAATRALLEEDDTALEAWVDQIAPIGIDGSVSLKSLAGKPLAIWRRALHRWLLRQDDVGDLSRAGFESLLAMAQDGGTRRFSLGKAGFVRIRRGRLFFEKLST